MHKNKHILLALSCLFFMLPACTKEESQSKVILEKPVAPPTVAVSEYDAEWDQGVTLTESTISWLTYDYELDHNNSVEKGSFDGQTIVQREFKAYIIENEYLKLTLVPDFGGRILSMIYKPTGHEELWQNPIGAPYLIGSQIFYHDWLMIWGGIFPTFPEPEHGKTWNLPWDFEVITDNGEVVEVEMSFIDEIDNPNAPINYPTGKTGIICRYRVRLDAGRAAFDTHVELENPNISPRSYEYWTNTGLAPGSEPGNSFTDEHAEIIVPIEKVRLPQWYYDLASEETPTADDRVVILDKLRWFKNWHREGILYAYPNMGGQNFWGVINHSNQEGIFRVADNTKTPGLKFWTFGFDSLKVDPFETAWAQRPFIELWAGRTNEFFEKTVLMSNQVFAFDETYSPSVGMTSVNGATPDILIHAFWDDYDEFNLQWFAMNPELNVAILITQGETFIMDEIFIPDPTAGNSIHTSVEKKPVNITITDSIGKTLFSGLIEP